jgi:ABC-2 type transport system ATP-binding protein
MSSIIRIDGLAKRFRRARRRDGSFAWLKSLFAQEYDEIRAVDGIGFSVEPGELIGYLGPNGAGKSTTLKMLTGLLVPTEGEIVVNGRIPWKERPSYVRTIGAVFGQRTTLWWDLPVIESLNLLQHMYRIESARFQKNLNDFRDLLELDAFLDTPVRSLSLGQRMRADLCAAMLHDPVLLFLDEPTIGLDVVAKERIRGFIRHINRERNVTVLLTTHDLSDVEKLCERVMIIDRGRLLFDGGLETLKERFGGNRELVADLAEEYETLEIEGAEVVERDGLRVTLRFDGKALSASELIGRLSARYRLLDLAVREPDIEDTIRRIYEGRLLEA